ncbi:kinase-like domain-containing protein [Cladorrhinum sp. PSN332]|nr:kinase-like domain-containing protein [Cladorrhinum sp. PSN332]
MSLSFRLPTSPPAGVVLEDEKVIYEWKIRKIWQCGDNIVKRRTAHPGNYEVASQNFVERYCPSIPIPHVIDEWENAEREHHFTLMTAIRGVSLSRAWANFSQDQKQQVAADVARHMRTLRQFTSDRMQSVSDKNLGNNCFVPGSDYARRTRLWKTDDDIFDAAFLPVLEYQGISDERITQIRYCMPPCVGQFALYHGDLYHGNIMVDPHHGTLTGIIDWEFTGYYPLWFHYARLNWTVGADDKEWKRMLALAMRDEIPHATHGLVWWHAIKKLTKHPKSKKPRDWLDLLSDHIGGYPLVVPLEEYESYRSSDYV